jgi:protein-S-isoprenylcysteine O-methyltransferase Ste14
MTLDLLVRIAVLCLAIAAFGSMAWGTIRFFRTDKQPSSLGLRLITSAGILFLILHLVCLFRAPLAPGIPVATGAALYALCTALFWWAVQANRRHPLSAIFSTDAPEHLTDCGPYRFIRHPFYTSYLCAWLAGVFATQQWYLIGTTLVMLLVYIWAARQEEQKFMHSPLASSYVYYRRNAGLFWPKHAFGRGTTAAVTESQSTRS